MATREISAVVAELEREVRALREEVEALKRQASEQSARFEQFAGSFTGDREWAAIHEAIEEQRRQPDPDLCEKPRSRSTLAGTSFLRTMSRNDRLIAAIALAGRHVLVTRNVSHFLGVPALLVENWIDDES